MIIRLAILGLLLGVFRCAQWPLKTRAQLKEERVSTVEVKKNSWEPVVEELSQQLRVTLGRLEELEHRLRELEKKPRTESQDSETLKALVEEMKWQRQELTELKAQVQSLWRKSEGPSEDDPWIVAQKAYEKGDCPKAVLDFQKARQKLGSKSLDRWAEATFKMASCLEKMNLKEDARAFWEELEERAPQSTWAKKSPYRKSSKKNPKP